MLKALKKDSFLYIILLLLLSTIGYSLVINNTSLFLTIITIIGSFTSVFIAYFFPVLFCYTIIFLAPLSINMPKLIGGIALSLPAEGMLGLILLLTFVKLFAGLQVNKKILYHPITIILFLDIAWMIITSFMSSMPEISYKRIVLKISFILGFYLLFSHLFKTPKQQVKLILLYSIGAIIPILNAFYNHAKFNFSQEESFEMTEPFYEDHTLYGACLAFLIPFLLLYTIFLIKKYAFSLKTYFYIFLFLLVSIAEILSYSRAAWISIMAALVLYIATQFKIKPKYYFITLGVVISLFTINFDSIYQKIQAGDAKKNHNNVEKHLETVTDLKSNASNLERINRWVCAYRMFEEKPIFGWGPGTYQFNYAQFQTNEFTTEISSNTGDRGNSHSEYFTYLSEEGLVGFVLFITLIFFYFKESVNLLNNMKSSLQKVILYGFFLGLFTFYIHGLFNTFSDFDKMSILVYGSLAGIVAISTQNNLKKINSYKNSN